MPLPRPSVGTVDTAIKFHPPLDGADGHPAPRLFALPPVETALVLSSTEFHPPRQSWEFGQHAAEDNDPDGEEDPFGMYWSVRSLHRAAG